VGRGAGTAGGGGCCWRRRRRRRGWRRRRGGGAEAPAQDSADVEFARCHLGTAAYREIPASCSPPTTTAAAPFLRSFLLLALLLFRLLLVARGEEEEGPVQSGITPPILFPFFSYRAYKPVVGIEKLLHSPAPSSFLPLAERRSVVSLFLPPPP